MVNSFSRLSLYNWTNFFVSVRHYQRIEDGPKTLPRSVGLSVARCLRWLNYFENEIRLAKFNRLRSCKNKRLLRQLQKTLFTWIFFSLQVLSSKILKEVFSFRSWCNHVGRQFSFLTRQYTEHKFKWTRSIASVQLQLFDFLYIVRSKRGHFSPPCADPVACVVH